MRLALLPMLQAETDRRAYVQEVEYQRLEALIMKDVPDFVPGESMYNNPKLDSVGGLLFCSFLSLGFLVVIGFGLIRWFVFVHDFPSPRFTHVRFLLFCGR